MTKNPMPSNVSYVFFGTGNIARMVLDELEKADLAPSLIITAPDAPAGRGRTLTPSSAAQWAQERKVKTLKPETFDAVCTDALRERARQLRSEVFVVADYGTILPRAILEIPPRGTLNMHPSLLPKLRGPSPIRTAILNDERETGVSIMLLDEKMDHGPLLAQKKVAVPEWPPRGRELDVSLAREGGMLLAETLPRYLTDEVKPREQDHAAATFSHFFKKEDGEIDLGGDAYVNLLKIRAFDGWPGAYTFFARNAKKIRVRITEAHLSDGLLVLDRVVPEGKAEMLYADFARSLS